MLLPHGRSDRSRNRARAAAPRPRLLRSPPRPVDAVLHRDVGALQLLRHAGAADPVHDRAGSDRRPRVRHGGCGRGLRPLHLDGVHEHAARWLARRSRHRPAARGALRRHPDRQRPLQHGVPVARHLLPRPVPDRHRHWPAQGQRQRHRRTAVWTAGRAPRCRVLDLLHGDQPRGVHRAAHLRLSRTARQLARGLCLRRIRHADRHRAIHAGRQVPRRRGRAPRNRRLAGGRCRRTAPEHHLGTGPACGCRHHRRRRLHRSPAHHRHANRRRRGLHAADPVRGVLRLAVPRARLDAGRAQAALRHRRLLPRGGAVLVALRAGRLHAQPVRRSRYADDGVRLVVSEQLVPVDELAVRLGLRAGVRIPVDVARPTAHGAVDARPSSRSG